MPIAIAPAAASSASAPIPASAPSTPDPAQASTPGAASATIPASAPQTPPQPKKVLIEAYGDDSMFGMNPGIGAPYLSNAPADLQALLRAQFGDRVTVSNEGAPGSTLGTLMSGSDGKHLAFDRQMAQSKADIVIVNQGINDSSWGGEDVPQFGALLTQFVAIAQKHGKAAIIEEQNPVCSQNYNVAPYAIAADAISGQSGAPLIQQYQSLLAIPNYCSHLSGQYYPDQYIYSIKAQHESVVLAPIVKTILGE